MVVVAIAALDLGAVRALLDGVEEDLLFTALPTVNILVCAGIVGFRSRRARVFTLGFVAVGTLSLVAFQVWFRENPWTFLRYFNPPFLAIDRRVEAAWPGGHMTIMYLLLILVFPIPHIVLGLAGGRLAATGGAILMRRRGGLSRSGRGDSEGPGAPADPRRETGRVFGPE
jgi:hypothetical protein